MLLAHKTKIKKLAIVLISSGLLAACNHTGSSSSSTSANATQHAAVNEAEEAQKILQVVNHSGSTIDHISIMSESGQVLFKSTTGLSCTNNQDCNVDLNGLITTKKMLAKLYNNKNQIISMVRLKDNSQKFKYTTVYANDTMFGAQLFTKLVAIEKLNKQAAFQQLIKFFSNSDQSVNVLTELGAYYSQQLANGRIHNEDEFYKLIINDISHGKVINGQKVLSQAYVPELQAGLLGCTNSDNELANHLFETVTPFFKIIPGVGEAVAPIAEGAKGIFNWACPAEAVNFAEEFKQINEKLDSIQETVDKLTLGVQELRDMENNNALSAELTALNDIYTKEEVFNSTYRNFMAEINRDKKESEKFQSVHEYVKSLGGLDEISPISKTIFSEQDGIVGSLSLQYVTMQQLTHQLQNLTTLLNAQCSDTSRISGDIIAKRNYCNFVATQAGIKVAAFARMSRLRMSDAVFVIKTSNHTENSSNPFGKTGITWDEALNKIREDYKLEIESVDTFYKKTLIMPTDGLPVQLVKDLNAVGNPFQCVESTPSGVRGIMEWYTDSTTKDKGKYIVTNCYQGKNNVNPIKSKYYYEKPSTDGKNGGDGDQVMNVLGTLLGIQVGVSRVSTVGYASMPIGISTWWGAINAESLKNAKIGGIPYIVNNYYYGSNYEGWPSNKVLFISESNYAGGYNANSSVEADEVVRKLWMMSIASYEDRNRVSIGMDGNANALWQDWIRVKGNPAQNRYYLLNKQGNEFIYNLWVPTEVIQYYPVDRDHTMHSATTVPLTLPVTLKNGNIQWVTFGLYHNNFTSHNSDTSGITGDDWSKRYTWEYMGVQCLTSSDSRCKYWKDDNSDMSRISMALDDGRTITISFTWEWSSREIRSPTKNVAPTKNPKIYVGISG